MTDKELLELAALAAGYTVTDQMYEDGALLVKEGDKAFKFNPLVDDGDAFRLDVKLRLDLEHNNSLYQSNYVKAYRTWVEMMRDPYSIVGCFDDENQRMSAIRREIVRAAAEIGRNLST